VHLRLRARPRLDPPHRPELRRGRATPHEAHHSLVRTRVAMLGHEPLVKRLNALPPFPIVVAIPRLISNPRLDDASHTVTSLGLPPAAITGASRPPSEPIAQRALLDTE